MALSELMPSLLDEPERAWQTKYWVEIERGRIHLLPVLLKNCQIPELLKTKKYADFRTDFNGGLNELLQAIERLVQN
ncbi:hypothetical protein RTE01_30560 [Raoultella terrigena]|nr:hypothetical protein RTE01_30560 [Raoultella terrigena]